MHPIQICNSRLSLKFVLRVILIDYYSCNNNSCEVNKKYESSSLLNVNTCYPMPMICIDINTYE